MRQLAEIRALLLAIKEEVGIPDSVHPNGLTWIQILEGLGFVRDGLLTRAAIEFLADKCPAALSNPYPIGTLVYLPQKNVTGMVVAVWSNSKKGVWEDANNPWLVKVEDDFAERRHYVADITDLLPYQPDSKAKLTWDEMREKAKQAKKGRRK